MRSRVLFPVLLTCLLSSACGGPAPAGTGEVHLSIKHSKFSPDELQFLVGQRVTFVIRNNDPIDHEFILGDEDVQNRHELGTEPHHDQISTEISVPAKGEVKTSVNFDKPAVLLIGCHLPGHYAYGMKAEVRVGT